MTFIIRTALAADAHALSELARKTFRDTYEAFNTAEDMQLHVDRTFTAERQLAEISDPGWLTLVAEHDGQLIGFAQGHHGSAPPCVSAQNPLPHKAWEILRFYVHRDWQGRGLAQELMERAGAGAVTAGADAIWLGVWTRNERAHAFYIKCGFTSIGEITFTLGADLQRDFVMYRPVPPA